MAEDRVRKAICAEMIRLLSAERQRQGLSMNVLAERSGLSQSFISMLESQPANPTMDTLLRITQVLNIELGELISRATANAKKTPNSTRSKPQ